MKDSAENNPAQPDQFELSSDDHHYLGIELNQMTWGLLGKKDRSPKDDKRMETFALASLHHWQGAAEFTPLNAQRGHWLLARVYTVLEQEEKAQHHAEECMKITDELSLKGFDLAYAYEAMARALALAKNQNEASEYYQKANDAGQIIAGEGDKKLFFQDLKAAPWFGMPSLESTMLALKNQLPTKDGEISVPNTASGTRDLKSTVYLKA